jgi:REP element-mobilizing transposase RayT
VDLDIQDDQDNKIKGLIMRERKKLRKRDYDYSKPGFYFITICVHQRLRYKNIFGEIRNKKMFLNSNGEILLYCWNDLPNHYHNIKLNKFVIMPDHFHGIIQIINKNAAGNGFKPTAGNGFKPTVGNGFKPTAGNGFKPFPAVTFHGLPEIIRGLKTFSSRRINEKNPDLHFRWQKSYYDNIIYNLNMLHVFQNYIIHNPENWKEK